MKNELSTVSKSIISAIISESNSNNNSLQVLRLDDSSVSISEVGKNISALVRVNPDTEKILISDFDDSPTTLLDVFDDSNIPAIEYEFDIEKIKNLKQDPSFYIGLLQLMDSKPDLAEEDVLYLISNLVACGISTDYALLALTAAHQDEIETLLDVETDLLEFAFRNLFDGNNAKLSDN